MSTVQNIAGRRVFAAGVAIVLGLAPIVAVVAGPGVDPAPQTIAQDECAGSDNVDDYSLQCVPTMPSDAVASDQLTEQEVASPGFNGPVGVGGGGHR